MNFSALSIRKPLPAILAFLLLTIAGLISFSSMKVQDQPDLDFPVIFVTAALPGASPVQLEYDVARKLENSLSAITHIRHIYTTINDGVVEVTVQFRLTKDVAEAMADVRDAVSRVRSELPVDLRDPVINKIDLAGVPILTYNVVGKNHSEQDISWYVDNVITKKLALLPGVGQISRIGGVDREVLVELNPLKMNALNVTAADISRQLRLTQQELSGGQTIIGGANQTVRTIGTVNTSQELALIDINLPDGRIVRLNEVADVKDTIAERSSIALIDGQRTVGFDVTRTKGASELEVAESVREAIKALNESNPKFTIDEAYNGVDPVAANFDGSMNLLYEGALLTIIVVFLFLKSVKATAISALAIPLSIIPTFLVMQWFGFTLNMITLLAIALVVGILVDDAIVEIENIMRHLRMGKSPMQAALDAADEIGLAVVATTLTLIAVFLPTAFMDGIVGQYFKQFGWTASVAILMSLLVARLITPMMAAYMLKPTEQSIAKSSTKTWYLGLVAWCLSHRKTTMASAVLFFIFSLFLIPFVSTAFFPPENGVRSQVKIELPLGSPIEDTIETEAIARKLLSKDDSVVKVFSHIGTSKVSEASLMVVLKPVDERERTQREINTDLRELLTDLPGARVSVGSVNEESEEFSFTLQGDAQHALTSTALAIQREIRTIPGLGSVYSNVSLLRPELIVKPDFVKAASLGVSVDAIGETLRIATAGDYEQVLAKLNLPDRQVPIRVRLSDHVRQSIDELGRLAVPGTQGNVPLSAVASIDIGSGTPTIERRDRIRRIRINVELNGLDMMEIEDQILALPSFQQLPPGVERSRGDREAQRELFSNFGLAIFTGAICVFMVLVLLFKSFLHPVTVMAALPLSMGGAFAALLLTNSSLSMPSLLGLQMLMGIAVKNSILLVDYALKAIDKGQSRYDALIAACNNRAQPIIMTSVAMAAGMLPIAIGWGADVSFRSPMAIAVIGGLVTSTLLSLIVIPVVFTIVDDFGKKIKRRVSKKNNNKWTGIKTLEYWRR